MILAEILNRKMISTVPATRRMTIISGSSKEEIFWVVGTERRGVR